jgi:hypothetical protein
METWRRLSHLPKDEEAQGLIIGLGIVVFVLCVAGGLLGLLRLRNYTREGWTEDQEAAAKWIIANTPRKSVFISGSNVFDIVPQLAGRVSLHQSDRLEWLFGLKKDEALVKEGMGVLQNPDAPCKIKKLKYVVNQEGVSADRQLHKFGDKWSKVYTQGKIAIWQRD